MNVKDANSKIFYDGGVALPDTVDNNPYKRSGGQLKLEQAGYLLYIIGKASNIQDPELNDKQVGLEVYEINSNQPIDGTKLEHGCTF